MKEALNIITNKLESDSEMVQSNIITMIGRYSIKDWSMLNQNEQRTKRIDMLRSMGDFNCSYICFDVDNEFGGLDQISGDYFASNKIYSEWCYPDEIEEYVNQLHTNEEQEKTFYDELELIYLEWMVRNWKIAKSKSELNYDIQYCISENNSQRCFDLNLLNWDSFIENYNYSQHYDLISKLEETNLNIKNRILMDRIGVEIQSLERNLIKDNYEIKFMIDLIQLTIKDNKDKILDNVIFSASEDKYTSRNESIDYMVNRIDELIMQGYREK